MKQTRAIDKAIEIDRARRLSDHSVVLFYHLSKDLEEAVKEAKTENRLNKMEVLK
jgi:translation initiation factor 2B subunit (eIF-2B alpha/beta/delta family)